MEGDYLSLSGFSTIHANNAKDAVNRMIMMCLRSGIKLDRQLIGKWVTGVIDIIILQKKDEDGVRRIKEIIEVYDYEGSEAKYNSLFKFNVDKTEKEGDKIKKIYGKHVQEGYLNQETINRIIATGVDRELIEDLIQ